MTTRLRLCFAALVLMLSTAACSPQEWIALRFGEVGQYDKAMSVARCESGLRPEARSPDGSNHGLFQINNVHRASFEQVTGRPWSDVYDAGANSLFARWLYDQQGWRPWACA